MPHRTSEDLAYEAIELLRKKNVHFTVRAGGHEWTGTIESKAEQ